MYDPVIGRWLTTDPYDEFWSPYLAMGNDPVNIVDPDGGMTDPPKEITPQYLPEGAVTVSASRLDFPRFDFADYANLTFEKPDLETFRNLALAFEAIGKGGNSPCVLNAANEIVVAEFLNDRIGFLAMSDVIEECMQKVDFVKEPTLDDLILTDKETRI